MNIKNKGFTFVEVLIAILIMGIIGGTAIGLFGMSQMFVDRQISSALRLNAERFTIDSIYAELHKGSIGSIDILSDDDPAVDVLVSDYKYIFRNDNGHVVLREWSEDAGDQVDRQLLGAEGIQSLMFNLSSISDNIAAHYMLSTDVIAQGVTRPEEGPERTIGRRIGLLGRPAKTFTPPASHDANIYTGSAVRFAFFEPNAAFVIIHVVPPSVPGAPDNTGDGLTWDTAKQTIQAGIDEAAETPNSEVWVKESETAYTLPSTSPVSYSMITLKADVSLYGGFSGTETALGDRDWEGRKTVLNGNDRVNHVITIPLGSTARIDGFTIIGGNSSDSNVLGTGLPVTRFYGAGIYNLGSPIIENCIFEGNSARQRGGGIYNGLNSKPIITNCVFLKNEVRPGDNAFSGGGAMYNDIGASPTITRCIFSGSSVAGTYPGGGIRNQGSNIVNIDECTFSGNSSGSMGGGISNETRSVLTVKNSTFSGNSSANPGGGIQNQSSDAFLTNCTFSENKANQGGGINTEGTNPILNVTNCTFSGNTSTVSSGSGGGGGLRIAGRSTITNTIVWGNHVTQLGKDILIGSGVTVDLGYLIATTGGIVSGGLLVTPPGVQLVPSNNASLDIVSVDRHGDLATKSIDVYIYVISSDTPPLAFNNSYAVDRGISNDTIPATDQRGVKRYNSTISVDIGAYELNPGSIDHYPKSGDLRYGLP